jgi:hypothetical protein
MLLAGSGDWIEALPVATYGGARRAALPVDRAVLDVVPFGARASLGSKSMATLVGNMRMESV